MIREVDLVSYLPPFIAEYKETNITLEAENPEFVLVWKAADRVLYNEFIATADEYGISRFEKILNILPSRDDTLESRRIRVQARWFMNLPYTWRMLIQKLASMCANGFVATVREYQVKVQVIDLDIRFAKEIYGIVLLMLPANMLFSLWVKYGGIYDIALKSTISIEFITSFYPRFNLPLLRLDRSWRLDGRGQCLNRYDSLEQIDLYPISIGVKISIDVQAVPANQIGILDCIKNVVKITEAIKTRSLAKEKIAEAEQMKILTSAEHNIGVGDIRVTNQNFLDGSWRFDGSRKLNGGLCTT